MSELNIVVLGGALAGPTAAARAREFDEKARIILIEREQRISHAQSALAYYLSGEVGTLPDFDRKQAESFEATYEIEVRTGAEAISIDPVQRELVISRDGMTEQIKYDTLIYALGAESRLPDPAPAARNIVRFRTLDDLAVIESRLARQSPRVLILGGGPVGLEAADGLIRHGADVTLVERQAYLLNRLGTRAAATARAALESRARVITGTVVNSFETSEEEIVAAALSSGERVETDLVISAIGLNPRTELLERAGVRLAPDRTVITDDQARTSLSGVYACGACASVPQVITGRPVWWPQAALADKAAQVAGANAAGANMRLSPAMGSMLVRVGDTTIGRTGLSLSDAMQHFGPEEIGITTIYAPSHERYFPASSMLLVHLFWNRGDGRVLGVEVAGPAGVDKRIDAAAGVIASGFTVERLAVLEFGYEPPYNAARDPLNTAATLAGFERLGAAQTIEPEELAPRLAALQVIDVRAPGSSLRKSIPGALSIPLEVLRNEKARLDRSRSIVTVSETGRRGWLAARMLTLEGFSDVSNLSGGLLCWELAHGVGNRSGE